MHGRTAQDVPRIRVGERDPGADHRRLVVPGGLEQFHRRRYSVLGVERFVVLQLASPLACAFHIVGEVVLLDVRAIRQHDGAEIARSGRCPDDAAEAFGHQPRHQSAVVDVRMAHHQHVDLRRVETEFAVRVMLRVAHGFPLEHAAIQQYPVGASIVLDLDQVFTTGYRSGGAVAGEGNGHACVPAFEMGSA